MAASEVEARQRLHRLIDDLAGTKLETAEIALTRLHRRQPEATSGRPSFERARGLLTPDPEAPTDESGEDRPWSVDRVLGMAAADRPPPTDEEVKRWLEERRIEKYG